MDFNKIHLRAKMGYPVIVLQVLPMSAFRFEDGFLADIDPNQMKGKKAVFQLPHSLRGAEARGGCTFTRHLVHRPVTGLCKHMKRHVRADRLQS